MFTRVYRLSALYQPRAGFEHLSSDFTTLLTAPHRPLTRSNYLIWHIRESTGDDLFLSFIFVLPHRNWQRIGTGHCLGEGSLPQLTNISCVCIPHNSSIGVNGTGFAVRLPLYSTDFDHPQHPRPDILPPPLPPRPPNHSL